MSGGHFNYTQYQLTQIADDIEQLIVDNDPEMVAANWCAQAIRARGSV